LKILIVDNVQCNMGDAAILLAMHASFCEEFGADTEITVCFCGATSDPGIYAQYYPELRFTRTLWHAVYDWYTPKWKVWSKMIRRTAPGRFVMQAKLHRRGIPIPTLIGKERELFREFADSDLIVVTGGAPLSSSWTAKYLRPHRVAEYQTALLLEKPLVFYAASYGPFTQEDDLPDRLRKVMERAAAVVCRDADALKTVRQRIGVQTDNVHQTIDEAILLTARRPQKPFVPERSSPGRLGIVAHKWHWLGFADPKRQQEEYEQRIAECCRAALQRYDMDIVFMTSHPEVPGSMFVEVDVPLRIREMLPAQLQSRAHMVTEFVHPQEFAWIMGQCDLVISSRLHGAILSLAGGAPVLALGYEPKTKGFLEQIGLEDWMLPMEEFQTQELLGKVCWMMDHRIECRKKRDLAVEKARCIALQNRKIARDAFEMTTHRAC
jgi:colanic acid/amylovoran biosynthesis protein